MINRDGTRNVFCPECREFIGTVSASTLIATAVCAVCVAAKNGQPLPAHVVAQMRSKTLDVTYSNPNFDPILQKDLPPDDEETQVEMRQDTFYSRVVQRVRASTAKTKIDEALVRVKKALKRKNPSSKVIAVRKRRARIFDGPIDK